MKKSIFIIQLGLLLILSSCFKDKANLPKVNTLPVSEVTWAYAIAGGEVIDDGGSTVTSRGICATTDENVIPTINDNIHCWNTTKGNGLGSFTDTINAKWFGMINRHTKTHTIRAYATNKAGTAYGEVLTFVPKGLPPSSGSIGVSIETVMATSVNVKYWIASTPPYLVDERGICYGTSSNPTNEGNHILVDWFSENYRTMLIENLTPSTTYYVRGYTKNESGIDYSPEVSFTTTEGEITDISGNKYQIKTIGTQIWITKNLETTKFNDGSDIPLIQDDLLWSSTSTSASCKYTDFGKLYNYYTVVDSRKLCPTGWHVPTDEDWKTLETFLGMSQSQADATGLRGTDEGGKLKYKGISIYDGWYFPNTGATNSSGFTALGAGYRSDNGAFNNDSKSANFWTSSEFDATSAWTRLLNYDNAQIIRLNIKKGYGFSVRCVKDQ
ncbi:MAG: hypothetical protein HXX16_05650 [Bacteroidales bacterium]|nr:hypothetical protein [Bacteroidales bacterium]